MRISNQSPLTPALVVSTALIAIYNWRFWSETSAAMWSGSGADTVFFASLFVVLVILHAIVLLLLPGRRAFQLVVSALLIIAAVSAYSADTYGVRIDREMIRNLFETDQREVLALLSPRLGFYLLALGLVPAVLVWRLAERRVGLRRQLPGDKPCQTGKCDRL